MINRPTSALFASLLVLLQLVAGPLTHAAPAANDDCDTPNQATHVSGGGITHCGDCPDEQVPTPPESSGGDDHCRTHVACSCPCAHTPALSAFSVPFESPVPPEAVATDLATPTFDPPHFDFLRPPN